MENNIKSLLVKIGPKWSIFLLHVLQVVCSFGIAFLFECLTGSKWSAGITLIIYFLPLWDFFSVRLLKFFKGVHGAK